MPFSSSGTAPAAISAGWQVRSNETVSKRVPLFAFPLADVSLVCPEYRYSYSRMY